MRLSRCVRPHLPALLSLAMLAGCGVSMSGNQGVHTIDQNASTSTPAQGATVTASLGNRQVAAHSDTAKVLYVRPQSEQALFQIDDAAITVSKTGLSWGDHQSLTLPANWKELELIASGRNIAIRVDGKSFSQIQLAT